MPEFSMVWIDHDKTRVGYEWAGEYRILGMIGGLTK